jgi:hypothetical protein
VRCSAKLHPDLRCLAPLHATGTGTTVVLNDELKGIGNADRAGYLEASTPPRYIANHAVNYGTAIESYLAGFQDSSTLICALVAHEAVYSRLRDTVPTALFAADVDFAGVTSTGK